MRLETRDRDIVREAFLNKVIRRSDLLGLGYFSSVGRSNSRLLALRNAGYLAIRNELSGVELRAPFYTCATKGVRLIAEEAGFDVREALKIHAAGLSDLVLRHSLRTMDIRLKLVRDCSQTTATTLLSWEPEIRCHHEFNTPSGRAITVKPDALAIIAAKERTHYLFVETDLGNASSAKFREKMTRYATYSTSGAFADAYDADHFWVLTVTTDERRLHSLIEASAVYPLTAITTWRRLTEESIVGDVFTTSKMQRATLEALL